MKEKKHYISLKFKGGNAFHQNGKRLKLTERIVNIGETADCDVRYESDGLQPEYYASIIQNEDGKSWRIVKRSQHVEICIIGKGIIGYAYQLNNGDHIQFPNRKMGLCFHSHYDNHYGNAEQKHFLQWAITGVLGLIALIVVAFNISNRNDNICTEDVESLEESVFYIKVDSVKRILVTHGKELSLPPTKALEGEAPTGTAFMTSNGILVTARHCVEYWVGTNLNLTIKVSDLEENDIIRWAVEVETFNQTHDADSMMQLQVSFSIFDFMGNRKESFVSTNKQVHINKEKDGIFMLADFNHDYYWRTIRPYFTDRQMELGDILWIDCKIDSISELGHVKMANEQQLRKIKNGTKIMICGYPMTGIGDKRMTSTEGVIRRSASIESENLFFEANINHGFSGGPVLMKVGNDVVAIGVASRIDSISSGLYKWAVPITEVKSEE